MATNLTRFDPFTALSRLDPFRDIEDLFNDFRRQPALRGRETEGMIKVDIAENEKSYLIKAEIPGVQKEDIQVAVDGNQVSISAESKIEKNEDFGTLVRNERYYGQHQRRFTLEHDVDDSKAEAKYHDGVLELTLPKIPGTGGRRLTIQ